MERWISDVCLKLSYHVLRLISASWNRLTPMNGFMINIEIIHMLVLAKGEILYKSDEESKNKEGETLWSNNDRNQDTYHWIQIVQLRVDLRSPKDTKLKSSGFITLSISSSDANGVAELAIRKLLQVVLSDHKTASTFDELIQNGMAGYRSDLAGIFKESISFIDTFINNMDELADVSGNYTYMIRIPLLIHWK